LAYSLDTDGGENYVIYFKDLVSGELQPDEISKATYEAEWANDSQSFFYTIQDDAKRSYKCFQHVLGSDPGTDRLIYHEQDELYSV
ncbi:MAG: oligopeptidase B, partial [Gammaproteobacteria bacterium]|nr:oligopeptidase B [Gammaproteobacteria bacterium]NIW49905.1 oligopeptidase B [Gammaproteobacteria bacterium]NIW98121.1 oligopeptidase B [Phycisphaerae bacterium]